MCLYIFSCKWCLYNHDNVFFSQNIYKQINNSDALSWSVHERRHGILTELQNKDKNRVMHLVTMNCVFPYLHVIKEHQWTCLCLCSIVDA